MLCQLTFARAWVAWPAHGAVQQGYLIIMINIKLFECITCLRFLDCSCVGPTSLSNVLDCFRNLDVHPLQRMSLQPHEKEYLPTHQYTALVL